MRFAWTDGYRAKVKAEVAGRELDRLKEKYHDALTPRIVWQEQRNKKAPLHKVFTWDNVEAANMQRDSEARALLRCIRVEVEEEGGSPTVCFLHVRTEQDGSCYMSTARVLSDPELRDQALAEAMILVKGAQKRFGHLQALAEVFVASERKIARLRNRGKRKRA